MTSVTFTSSGSWSVAAASVDCQCWGEGGNGGTSTHGSRSGAGGGGGEYAEETALATSGVSISFTIGAGGTSTSTSFPGTSVTVTAHFGASASGSSSGAGGNGSTNSIHSNGGNGAAGTSPGSNDGGGGGGGSGGATGAGGTGTQGGVGTPGAGGTAGSGGGAAGGAGGGNTGAGADGNAPGGGAGGGGSGGTINHSGGTGASGQITLTYNSAVSGTASLTGTGTLSAAGFLAGSAALSGVGTLSAVRSGSGNAVLAGAGTLAAAAQQRAIAALTGTGTLSASGGSPAPAIVNQWANSYGQGTTFATVASALQSCVTGLTPDFSVGVGSGTPSPGNWLFCIASWTQNPGLGDVHVGTGDDIHSYWRQFPASGSGGNVRTSVSYTPNIARAATRVYVAPDGEVAAINVLVVEISGLGPWDTVTGTDVSYTASGTSVALSLSAPPRASFFIGAVGGDNAASGQAFLPSGYTGLATQTQTNGSNHLADNILTAAVLPSSTLAQNVSGTSSSSENLSGFLLGVEVNADSPIPASQNPNWPFLKFEAAFGAGFNTPSSELTWTDLTGRLWNWDETTGIQYQLGEIQATFLELQADNVDQFLTSTNASSPYFPNVEPGTPVRLRMALGTIGGTIVNRWYILQRNAQEWTEEIDEQFRQYVNTTGTDLWNALSATPPTFYRSEIYGDAPSSWWPLDDQPGTAGVLPTELLNAALGNTKTLGVRLSPNGALPQVIYDTDGNPLGTTSGVSVPPSIATYAVGTNSGWMFGDPVQAPPTFDTGNPVSAQPGSASWQQSGHAGSTGSYGWYLICNDSGFPQLSSGITVEGWFNYQFFGSATGYTPTAQVGFAAACQQPFCPLTLIELATSSHPVAILQLDIDGHLNLVTYNGSTPTSHSVYTASDLRMNGWFQVTLTATNNTWTVWLNGGATAQVSGSGAGMTSAWTYLIANADFGSAGGSSPASIAHSGNVSVSHLAVYPYILPYYRIYDHYWAATSAFGQIPAPTAPQVTWAGPAPLGGSSSFTPDGSLNNGSYLANSAPSASAVVVASIGGFTSGPSARAVGTAFNPSGSENYALWVGWTGVAPFFDLYTASSLGSETEAAVVAGSGDAFASGYGASASGQGVAHFAGGDGSSPPAAASSVGDNVGQRLERLMRNGKCVSPQRCIDQATELVVAPGSTGGGTQAGTAMQAVQASDDGFLFIDNCGNLTYWERPHLAAQYSSPVWQIGPSAGKIPYYVTTNWVTDPQRVFNAISVAPQSPTGAALPIITPSDATAANASQQRYGAQPLQITSWLQDPAKMQAQADWLLQTFGTPRRRSEQLLIDAGPYPAAWPLVIGINVGDIVTLEDWRIGGGGAVYTMRVTEIKRRLDFGTHNQPPTGRVTLTCDFEPTSYWS